MTLSSEEHALFNDAREALEGYGPSWLSWFKRFHHKVSVMAIIERMEQPVGTPTHHYGVPVIGAEVGRQFADCAVNVFFLKVILTY